MTDKPTVLIVDDEQDIRKMLVEALSLEGYVTETAANGREALDILKHGQARIVLLDVLMPVMDGRGMLTELSSNRDERVRHWIILMSAIANFILASDLEVDGILPKPFHVTDLLKVLDSAYANRREQNSQSPVDWKQGIDADPFAMPLYPEFPLKGGALEDDKAVLEGTHESSTFHRDTPEDAKRVPRTAKNNRAKPRQRLTRRFRTRPHRRQTDER